ncbi:hypothetical protein [Aquiflexum sp.]|uniref:hypothetical protein n=1 Tax=Aquiflexum sp. TaxID=1872584 RepID=UPI0035942841
MKPKKTTYKLLLFMLTGAIFISCANRNTEEEYADRENDVNERSDFHERNDIDERTEGSWDDEALNPGSYIDAESNDPTLGQNTQNTDQTRFIPLTVYNIIRNDSSLRDQELIDSRPFKRDKKVYYEMHFKRDGKVTVVTFDLDGNHTEDYN